MKRILTIFTALVLALGLMQSSALACKGCKGGQKDYHKMSMKDKFFKKIKMIYLYQDELGLSDQQLDQIKKLKIALKKDLIQKKADIKIVKVDIKSMMYEDQIDVGAVNKLVDKKYEIKKAKAKKLVEAFAQLKKILNKAQVDKLKDIYHGQMKMHMAHGSYKGSRK